MGKFKSKILIYSVLLGCIPTVIIGIFSYFIAAGDVEEKVNEGNLHILNQTRMRVEQVLDSMQRTALQFENSSLLKSAMGRKLGGEDFIQVRELMKEMFHLQTQAILNQVYVVNLDQDWMLDLYSLKPLNSAGNDEIDRYLEEQQSIFWVTGSEALSRSPYLSETEEGTPSGERSKMLRLVHKIPLLNRAVSPSGMLILQISAKDIRDMLEPDNLTATQYILDDQGEPFLSTGQEREAFRDINLQIKAQIGEGNSGHAFHAETGGQKMSVQYVRSAFNGWSYVSIVPLDKVTEQTKVIGLVTASACLLIMGTVLVASLMGSRRMYLPIRKLHEFASHLQPQQTELQQRDEFEDIRGRLYSLALSRNQLDRQMKSQTAQLKEFYVLKLFTEQMPAYMDAQASERYGFPEGWDRLAVLTLELDIFGESRFQEQDRELLLFAVNNIVSETVAEASRFSPIVLNHAQVTLLAWRDQDHPDGANWCYETARQIKSKVQHFLSLSCSIGISLPFRKLADTKQAYKESMAALQLRLVLGPDIVVCYADIEDRANSDKVGYTRLKLAEDKVILALEERQPEKLALLFDQYLDQLLHRDGFHQEHSLWLMQLVSRSIHVIQDQGLSMQRLWNGEDRLKKLFRLHTRQEICAWFHGMLFTPIMGMLEEMADQQFVNIAGRMMEMVHDQFHQDISLDYCAAVMNFNPSYISRVFKKETGVAFTDYLVEYRMNAARRLLETTDRKISDIAREVSYTNISAFIRTFRRTFGLTPGQYRKQSEQEHSET